MTEIDYSEQIAKHESVNWNVLDQYKGMTLSQLRQVCRNDELPYAVCALSVTGELNIGMMMRSACLLGAENFFIVGRRKYDKRSTVGTYHYINLHRISMLNDDLQIDGDSVISMITAAGYTPVPVEGPNPYCTPQNVRNIDWAREFDTPPCLIFGSESDGIPDTILQQCRPVVSVIQLGVLRSFNVSSAAAIVMHEVASQLQAYREVR